MPIFRNPIRQRIVNQCWWGIAHTAQIHYSQTRPVPLEQWKARRLPITTDCSGYATCCYFAAGAPDPNGQGYDTTKAMFTGSMLAHLKPITKTQLRGGDLVVYGGGTGEHVCIVLEPGADPLLASHGGEVGPIDIHLSQETRFHAGQPVTYLRGVPLMRTIRKKRLIVVADGKTISHASGVWRWMTRHRRLAKKFGDELTFRRVKTHAQDSSNAATHKPK